MMRFSLRGPALTLLVGLVASSALAQSGPFLTAPYVQLGDAPRQGDRERLSVVWHTEDSDGDWSVEYRPEPGAAWVQAEVAPPRRVAVPTIAPHRVYQAALTGLKPGSEVEYRVLRSGQTMFTAEARTRKPPGVPSRVVVLGDCGAGTPEQKLVAYQIHQARPDSIVVTGDIVYSRGRISEYRERFFPVYNATVASPHTGAPLLRSVPFLAAPGNHDISTFDLEKYPDAQAFFLYWDQPRNGPWASEAIRKTPKLTGPEATLRAFHDAAGSNYPRLANFSFDQGDAHWLVLDSNSYVDWSNWELRDWITRDLTAARDKTWRFVAFHHPGFSSSRSHFNDQRTRLLAPLFEQLGVAIVFAGHVHNYQRSHPLKFVPAAGPDTEGRVAGTWTLDRSYDGRNRTRPDGVLYLVTGAGGARLYNPEQQDDPATWQPFTHVFVSKTHSLTIVDLDGPKLTVRQISEDGSELDRFVVTQ